MANDTISNYVQNFVDGKISRNAFWELAKLKKPTHQISFHTERALKTLQFVKGYVTRCRYEVPDYWAIGEVYERLIEDVTQTDVIDTLHEVYSSWISEAISNYNSDFFYQPRDYIRECYLAGEVI